MQRVVLSWTIYEIQGYFKGQKENQKITPQNNPRSKAKGPVETRQNATPGANQIFPQTRD